jgi:DNA-binding LacI/PurR family transcriptional regulator
MARRPTIADIAREAGVSKGAVSYALNGQPGVSDTTRKRILAISATMGYTPNSAARTLAGGGAATIGLVVSRPASVLGMEPFFMDLISGIGGALAARSFGLTLQVVADHDAEIDVYQRWWRGRHVDGILLADVRIHDQRLEAVRRLQLPAVAIAGPGDFGSIPAVWSDDAAAITQAVEYLTALGHDRIARVSGLPTLLHTDLRNKAFAAICARRSVEHVATISTDYTGEDGRRATRRLLSNAPAPTAIIYDNDIMALAGMSVAKEMGLRVPEDLSVIAWDDSVLCTLVHPSLTALSRDVAAYGATAAQTLLALIGSGGSADIQHGTADLKVRGSTAPPAQRHHR